MSGHALTCAVTRGAYGRCDCGYLRRLTAEDAGVEVGSSRGLRPLAPEGIDALRAERDAVLLPPMRGVGDDEGHRRHEFLWRWLLHKLGMDPTCREFGGIVGHLDNALADAKAWRAVQSRGAAPSPTPEGLMPCPSCGGPAEESIHARRGWIGCASCDLGTAYNVPYRADSTEVWNRRTATLHASVEPDGIDARLRDALTKCHLALADLGSRIQRTADATWVVRRPHSEMPAVIAAVDEAMLQYHAVTRATGQSAAPVPENANPEGPAG
jgi:hypothetical protein